MKKKQSFVHSIGMKIVIFIALAAIISSCLTTTYVIQNVKKTTAVRTQDNMMDLAIAYKKILNPMIQANGGQALDYDSYHEILSDVKLRSVSGSYAYVVSSEGTMMYHSDDSKVGNPVENDCVKGLVAEIQGGTIPKDDVVSYLYKGANKYAAYAILDDVSILVVTAGEKESLEFISSLILNAIIMGAVFVILCIIAGFFAAKTITNPLAAMGDIIEETARLDFGSRNRIAKLEVRKDEIGNVSKAIASMREALRQIIGDIGSAGDDLDQCLGYVDSSSAEIDRMCGNTSSTTQQIAAGMEETSASAEAIGGSIDIMTGEAKGIKGLAKEGENLSCEIINRAETLNKTTEASTRRTTELYESVREKTNKSIKDAEAVSKINELTDAIMSISSQTSLLALNANIEAARAGEAGRGFAVVATEIGSLANQTSETVNGINDIVNIVNGVVSGMADTLKESLDFLENVVLKDYAQFEEVSEQYKDDARTVQSSMEDIERSIDNLTASIEEVADSLKGISVTVGDATSGVTEIAGMTSDINAKTVDNKDKVGGCMDALGRLREIQGRFKL